MTLFEFQWPWFALLLPVPLLLPLVWREQPPTDGSPPREEQLEGERITLLHPHLDELKAAYQARRPRRQLAGSLHRVLLLLLWAGLVLALMRPQWLVPHTEVSAPGYDLMLAVDASHSMDALDFTVEGRRPATASGSSSSAAAPMCSRRSASTAPPCTCCWSALCRASPAAAPRSAMPWPSALRSSGLGRRARGS